MFAYGETLVRQHSHGKLTYVQGILRSRVDMRGSGHTANVSRLECTTAMGTSSVHSI